MTRSFQDLISETELNSWGHGTFGDFYVTPGGGIRNPGDLVRHFNSDGLELLAPYVDVIDALTTWVERRPDVAALVEVRQLTEVGTDFVTRQFEVYYYSLKEYDDPVENDLVEVIPEELEPMRQRVARHLERTSQVASETTEAVLNEIITASLLGPSRTTVMGMERWLIVSPKVTVEQLKRWNTYTRHATTPD